MLLARKYRNDDAGDDAGGSTTGVETETGDTGTADTGSTETVLTDTGDTGAAEDDVAAAQVILDAGDESSAEDKAAAQAIVDAAAEDAGKEGSDVVPDTYADFVLPEGMQLDEALLTEATPMFKDLGLTQEQAQKLIDFQAKQVQAGSQKQIDDFNQLKSDWRDLSKNDGEFGGDKFDENVKIAQSAISKYGTSELKQLLEDHGVGNHPEVIRFMVRVGQTLKEDVPGSTGGTPTKAEDAVSILYPNDS
jgi:hypothetical protein